MSLDLPSFSPLETAPQDEEMMSLTDDFEVIESNVDTSLHSASHRSPMPDGPLNPMLVSTQTITDETEQQQQRESLDSGERRTPSLPPSLISDFGSEDPAEMLRSQAEVTAVMEKMLTDHGVMHEKLEKTQQELKVSKDRIQSLEMQLASNKESARVQYSDAQHVHEQEVDKLLRQLRALQKSCEEQAEQAREALALADKQIEEKRGEVARLDEEMRSFASRQFDAEREKETIERELTAARADAAKRADDVENRQAVIDELERRNAKFKLEAERCQHLQAEVDKMTAALGRFKLEEGEARETSKTAMKVKEAESESHRKEAERKNEMLQTATARAADLEAVVADLKQALDQMNEKLRASEDDRVKIGGELQKALYENAVKTADNEKLESDLSRQIDGHRRLSDENDMLKRAIEERDREAEAREDAIKKLESDLSGKIDGHRRLSEEIAMLERSIEERDKNAETREEETVKIAEMREATFSAKLQEQTHSAQERETALAEQLRGVTETSEKRESELVALTEELQKSLKDAKNAAADARKIRERMAELEAASIQRDEELRQAKSKVDHHTRIYSLMEQQLKTAQQKAELAQSGVSKEEMTKMTTKITDLEQRLAAKEDTIRESTARSTQLQQQLITREQQVLLLETAKKRAEEGSNENAALRLELDDLNKEVTSQAEALTIMEEQRSEAEAQLNEKDKKIEGMRKRLAGYGYFAE